MNFWTTQSAAAAVYTRIPKNNFLGQINAPSGGRFPAWGCCRPNIGDFIEPSRSSVYSFRRFTTNGVFNDQYLTLPLIHPMYHSNTFGVVISLMVNDTDTRGQLCIICQVKRTYTLPVTVH